MHSLNTRKLQAVKIPSYRPHTNSNKVSHKLPSNLPIINSIQKLTTQTINVITRNIPKIEPSTRPIIRRLQAPNKKKITQKKAMDKSSKNPLVTIKKQSEETDNIGKRREPLQPNLHPEIFPLSNSPGRMPDYRKHLAKIFGGEFLAEATKQDRSLTPVIRMIIDKDGKV